MIDFDLRALLADPQIEALLRILVAGVAGVVIGFERELEHKPAGARTFGGVAMGAATFTVVGILAFGEGDPASRVAAQIITGIGFLGAGTILHMRGRIVGLTTAAGLWMMAAIGMAIGAGLWIVGIGATVAILLLLRFIRPEWLVGRDSNADPEAPADDSSGR
jgi:putative Mg2+ transporter-C (MgtC) family protein